MTTTDPLGGAAPAPAPSPSAPQDGIRRLRRSRTQRVGAGVAGGLGEYFGLDPVLFRVLFATAAFFGGAGILAYLLAWAAIPEAGTERAPVDGWIRELRRRKVPIWVVAVLAGLFLWVAAFSWWAPGPFFPVLAVVVLLVVAVTRSSKSRAAVPVAPVSLTKPAGTDPNAAAPGWMGETREWIAEAKQASRRRARRALPVKIATLVVLGGTLLTLALVDAAHGVAIPLYFWLSLAIVVVGLLAGLALRRTPWSITPLLVLSVAGLVAFGGTHARFRDSVGNREWRPTSMPAAQYRLAFGNAVLDLRALPPLQTAQHVRIDVAAGQVKVLALRSQDLTVDANVHLGQIEDDGSELHGNNGGVNVNRTSEPDPSANGAPITVTIHLADGTIVVERS